MVITIMVTIFTTFKNQVTYINSERQSRSWSLPDLARRGTLPQVLFQHHDKDKDKVDDYDIVKDEDKHKSKTKTKTKRGALPQV